MQRRRTNKLIGLAAQSKHNEISTDECHNDDNEIHNFNVERELKNIPSEEEHFTNEKVRRWLDNNITTLESSLACQEKKNMELLDIENMEIIYTNESITHGENHKNTQDQIDIVDRRC